MTKGAVQPAIDHVNDTAQGVHGSSKTPIEGRIAVYSSGGRIKAGAPTESDDLVTKWHFETNTQRSVSPASGKLAVFNASNRLQSSYPVSGEDVATHEFVINALAGAADRTYFKGMGYTAAAAGIINFIADDGDGDVYYENGEMALPPGLYLLNVHIREYSLTVKLETTPIAKFTGNTGTVIFRISSSEYPTGAHVSVFCVQEMAAADRNTGFAVEVIGL